jgi:hypothetical protein
VLRVLASAVADAFLPATELAKAFGQEDEPCGCCRSGLTCTNSSCCSDDRVCNDACCPASFACEDGTRIRSGSGAGNPSGCLAGQAPCGALGCVDVMSDLANCGVCGNVCPADIIQLAAADACGAVVSYDWPTSACASMPVASCDPAPGSEFTVGTHDVTCTCSSRQVASRFWRSLTNRSTAGTRNSPTPHTPRNWSTTPAS